MPIQSSSEDAGSTVRLNDFNSAVLQPRLLRKHIARSRLYVIERETISINSSSTWPCKMGPVDLPPISESN